MWITITFTLLALGPSLKGSHGQWAPRTANPDPVSTTTIGPNEPYINPILSADVIGVLGKEVRLKCHVTNLANKTISWIRHRDIHLLTVGRYTYTSDQRFSAHHLPLTHFWQLRIRSLTHRDAGQYECQVSTTPPRGHIIELKVVEPHTEILGGPDMHVDQGSTINLTCVAKFSPSTPPDVEWYHNGEIISYDSLRGGVSVVIEKGDLTTSHLLIQRATPADSGVYRCVPVNTVEAAINLHVLRGKNPDAWQTSAASSLASREAKTLLIMFGLLQAQHQFKTTISSNVEL